MLQGYGGVCYCVDLCLEKCRNHCQVAFVFWLFIPGGRESEKQGQQGWGSWELESMAGGTHSFLTLCGPDGWQPTHFSLWQFSLPQAHLVVICLACALTPITSLTRWLEVHASQHTRSGSLNNALPTFTRRTEKLLEGPLCPGSISRDMSQCPLAARSTRILIPVFCLAT